MPESSDVPWPDVGPPVPWSYKRAVGALGSFRWRRDGLRYAVDFEKRIGEGRVQIRYGHPGYCPLAQQGAEHSPHRFSYQLLRYGGDVVTGSYECDGEALPVLGRPS